MLSKVQKDHIIKKFSRTKSDTGSTEVQVSLLTAEIDDITKHLQIHKKDHSSRRGLLRKVGQRRRLLRYFAVENPTAFKKLTTALGLKTKMYETAQKVESKKTPVVAEVPAHVEPSKEIQS
ncbi:MAG: 30S ribosomal protein S15 [Candidatus Kerfeldbacteria bacterium]|nr:30S ribosomal protein S15 [Candidatus Kerfeldbacteria bacterium]